MADQADIIESEEWRDVPGWPGYTVSSLGRVAGKRKELGQRQLANGYTYVPLSDGKRKKTVSVHRIVMAAFVGEKPKTVQVNHKNNARGDNRLCNLEYLTAKENCQYRRVHGTFPTRGNNGRAKLTEQQVKEIRERRKRGEKLKPLAQEFGVHQNTIWWVVSGGTWTE